MKTILINGDFLCRTLTGIERYAFELTIKLDSLFNLGECAIIVPQNAPELPPFKNIEIIRHKKTITSHLYWQMITLQGFLLTHPRYIVLEYGNTCLPLAPGIVFLHDIYCAFYKEDFTSKRDKLIRLYNKWQYRLITHRAKLIITVSQFSRSQIAHTYHIDEDKIQIVYSAWDHFRRIQSDESVFNDFPALKRGKFYFSLGSLSKRKNIQWIIRAAFRNPASLFAVTGKSLPTLTIDNEIIDVQKLPNLILTGYLPDEKVKALMSACKAFIQPSYYEGFGLPPLEALSCGAAIIVARAASLPEIYGKAAHYIDPDNADIDLDRLLAEPVESGEVLLNTYTFDSQAKKLHSLITKFVKK